MLDGGWRDLARGAFVFDCWDVKGTRHGKRFLGEFCIWVMVFMLRRASGYLASHR